MLDVTYIYALLDPFEKQEFHIYIGKSDDPYKRYYQHLREKSNTHKCRWIQKLLQQNLLPNLQILEVCNIEYWENKEQEWIIYYKKCNYNVVNEHNGGCGGSIRCSDNTKLKISKAHIGKIPWNRGKIGVYNKATLKKMSDKNKGKASRLGAVLSEETKEKIRKSLQGKKLPLAVKLKISEAEKGCKNPFYGHHHSEETKRKLRIAHLKKNNI